MLLPIDLTRIGNPKVHSVELTRLPVTNVYQLITLEFGIFYGNVRIRCNNVPLIKGVDYNLIYPSKYLKDTYNLTGYGAILIMNKRLTSKLDIKVFYAGGVCQHFNKGLIPNTLNISKGLPSSYLEDITDTPNNNVDVVTYPTAEKQPVTLNDASSLILAMASKLSV